MSRQPSASPAESHPQHLSSVSAASRQKTKPYPPVGIAAGAEDVKYQAKYKELKRKVKEIESDNDKLQFKVLQAKRSIQRMKLERALLYERLSVVPPSPDMHDRQALPPINSGSGIPPHHPPAHISHGSQHHRESSEHAIPVDPDDRALMEYIRTHGNIRVVEGPDGRPIPVTETPMGPGVAPASHGVSVSHSSRRISGTGHDSSRQLPPLTHLPPVQHFEQTTRTHGHPHSHLHSNPHVYPHSSSPSHERSRSSHSSRSRPQHSQYHHGHQQPFPTDALPPVQHVIHNSPPQPGERDRPRRHDPRELSAPHGDSHSVPRPRLPSQVSPASSHSPTDSRAPTRSHHHRVASTRGDVERERELDRDREWDHEHEREPRERDIAHNSVRNHSPPLSHRPRLERPGDYQERPTSRTREEGYYLDVPTPGYRIPRPGSPGSGSGSGSGYGHGEGRQESQVYDRDRARYTTRHANPTNEDLDFIQEDGRSRSHDRSSGGGTFPPPLPDHPRLSQDSRKRSRHDMEVDDDNEAPREGSVGAGRNSGGGGYSGSRPDIRVSKRLHREPSTSSIRGRDDHDDEGIDG